ncbi:hypothetical protein O3G_MSEX014682 [Manduca sexta]|uniref:Uncharacterized protein n=1 Tax=Manduca sexta TaxID=7130 RepID=A0A922D0M2_MANSE|nr:hypothetical protein O3G_MSEX014682 [Manduca sexta]
MLDVLCPLITESDVVSNELLNVILMNLVEPNKRDHKHAYALAKELIVKTNETLEPYIQAFFNHVLILGKEEKTLLIFSKVYELIYELYQCCPSVLLSVLPQLECKLKSAQFQERLSGVALLARMFSEPGSELAKQYPALWRAFLGRFNDISVPIRIKCVQYCMHFLVHHPGLRKDITETLKLRQHDAHEQVRYEVVMAIIATAQRDFQAVAESEDLLHFVRERTLDKKFKIRKEAMSGLAMIYKKFLTEETVPPATEKAVQWIKDKILHGYYMTALEDRLLVERLLNTSLVPYTLPAPARMKKLYYLMSNVDDNATKAFIELQKHQLAVRRTVAEWIELHRKPATPAVQKELIAKVLHISSKFLPESVKAQEFLNKFSLHMKQAPELLQGMETILNPNVSCEVCVRTTSSVLKKLGQPVMTNLYYNTVKMLLERVSSVMIDHESLLILVGYVEGAVKGTDPTIADECDSEGAAGARGRRRVLGAGGRVGIPNKCLPLDFMGMYALAGREPERRIRALVRQYMLADVVRRREYVRNITVGTKVERAVSQLPHILPDYMLVFAVPILTHDPAFTAYDNVAQLKVVKNCLWFVLEPLITRNDFYCYGFYKSLVERMKLHKDALNETDDAVNYKLWAVCDLAMSVIWARSTSFELRDFPSDARIPTMYFSPQPDYFANTRVFLPPELQFQPKRQLAADANARGKKRPRPITERENTNDVEPSEASDTQIQLPGLEQTPETELDEPQSKRASE